VPAVHRGLATWLVAEVLLLAVLAGTVGLGVLGWVVGVSCAGVGAMVLDRGLARHGRDDLGPADWVTLGRATLAGGVAALTADSYVRPVSVPALVTLTVVALALDAVDGQLARRTHTESTFGAHFDGEVDAFLILVLSAYVASSVGAWVLLLGAARYAFLAAGWLLPWLGAQLPPRYWRKVVTAYVGVALTFAVAAVLPWYLTDAALAVALVLLAESFGRDVGWLWREQRPGREVVDAGTIGVREPWPVSD
jgi:phosphatidylglycerophosphate synthase